MKVKEKYTRKVKGLFIVKVKVKGKGLKKSESELCPPVPW